EAGERVRSNGTVFARPQEPPFRLWDRTSNPPERDRFTDRPYCTLRFHEPTRSLYICAFSGIDKERTPEDPVAFSKNLADALLRFDLRTGRWHEVERHDIEAGGSYPHHDPQVHGAPAGWLNGPDNCLPLGRLLYAVAKDNSVLVRYDLGALIEDPEAGHPPGEVVFDRRVRVEGLGERVYDGHSALAFHEGWLYVGYRTSSVVVRLRLDEEFMPVEPVRVQLLARFGPFDPATNRSANITDMSFDEQGRLYVLSATPARIFRFRPDPGRVFDARDGGRAPWLDLARSTGNPAMKSENILCEGGWLYVTSGDGYDRRRGTQGTVYRLRLDS
ncbi:MAG: hypothetical protein ACYS0D_15885, partial [Planctomycetota bacterium]